MFMPQKAAFCHPYDEKSGLVFFPSKRGRAGPKEGQRTWRERPQPHRKNLTIHQPAMSPAMQAVMKFANVPASMARSPSFASSERRSGMSDPIPPT